MALPQERVGAAAARAARARRRLPRPASPAAARSGAPVSSPVTRASEARAPTARVLARRSAERLLRARAARGRARQARRRAAPSSLLAAARVAALDARPRARRALHRPDEGRAACARTSRRGLVDALAPFVAARHEPARALRGALGPSTTDPAELRARAARGLPSWLRRALAHGAEETRGALPPSHGTERRSPVRRRRDPTRGGGHPRNAGERG